MNFTDQVGRQDRFEILRSSAPVHVQLGLGPSQFAKCIDYLVDALSTDTVSVTSENIDSDFENIDSDFAISETALMETNKQPDFQLDADEEFKLAGDEELKNLQSELQLDSDDELQKAIQLSLQDQN